MSRHAVVTFVTSNKNKVQELSAILDGFTAVQMPTEKIELPELQGTPQEISREKCKQAFAKVGGPVLVEDVSLCFNALNGLPGPYIKSFLEGVGLDGLNRMLAGFDDKTAYALCTYAYLESASSEPILFEGKTHGSIVPARGSNGFGWDPIFEVAVGDQRLTYAEMDDATKNKISHRYRALEQVKKHFAQAHAAH